MKINYEKPILEDLSQISTEVVQGASPSPCGGPVPTCINPVFTSSQGGRSIKAPLVLDSKGNPVIFKE